jgi:hypothetical protein
MLKIIAIRFKQQIKIKKNQTAGVKIGGNITQ